MIHNHAIPDQSAYKKLNHYKLIDVDRTLRLYDAFKDADGLDRVRIKTLIQNIFVLLQHTACC